jgi:hypothetical protein
MSHEQLLRQAKAVMYYSSTGRVFLVLDKSAFPWITRFPG